MADMLARPAVDPLPLQRLATDRIVMDHIYVFRTHDTGKVQTGRLVSKGGGWYTFDNGKARGHDNVLQDVSGSSAAAVYAEGAMVDVPPAESKEDHEAKDDMESKQDEEARKAPQTLVDVILNIARGFGLASDVTLLSAVLQYTKEQLETYRENRLLKLAVTDEGTVASCMATADALLELFAVGPVSATTTALRTSAGMQATAEALVESIRSTAANGQIHHIIYGIHGFSVVTRINKAEILQSFASGTDPETLGHNFKSQRSGSIDEVCGWIADMAAGTDPERMQGQTKISGDTSPELEPNLMLEDQSNVFPNLRFEWKRAALPTAKILEERIRQRMGNNLEYLKVNLPRDRSRRR